MLCRRTRPLPIECVARGYLLLPAFLELLGSGEAETALEPNELVTGIRSTLISLPKTGPIKGGDFAALCGVIHLLGNIPEAREIAENLLVDEEPEVESAEETINELEATEEENEVEIIPDLIYVPQFEEAPSEWF